MAWKRGAGLLDCCQTARSCSYPVRRQVCSCLSFCTSFVEIIVHISRLDTVSTMCFSAEDKKISVKVFLTPEQRHAIIILQVSLIE